MEKVFKAWYKKNSGEDITPFSANDIFFVEGNKYKIYKEDSYADTVKQVRNMYITQVMEEVYNRYKPLFKGGILKADIKKMREYVACEGMPGEETLDNDFIYEGEKYRINKLF